MEGYQDAFEDCSEFIMKIQPTILCSACDLKYQQSLDLTSNTIALDAKSQKVFSDKCSPLIELNKQKVFPYLAGVEELVKCNVKTEQKDPNLKDLKLSDVEAPPTSRNLQDKPPAKAEDKKEEGKAEETKKDGAKKEEPKKKADKNAVVTEQNVGDFLNFGANANLQTEGNPTYVLKLYARARTFLGKDQDPQNEAKLKEEAEKQKVTKAKAEAKAKADSDAKEQAEKKEKEEKKKQGEAKKEEGKKEEAKKEEEGKKEEAKRELRDQSNSSKYDARRLSSVKFNKRKNLKKKSKYVDRDLKQLEEEDQLNLENLFNPSDDKDLNDERLLDDSLDIRLLGEEDTDGRILPEDYADEYGRQLEDDNKDRELSFKSMKFIPDVQESKLYNDQPTEKEIESGARLLGDVPSKDDTKADNSASSNAKKDKKAAAVAKMMEEKTKTETSLKETTQAVTAITADLGNVVKSIEAAVAKTNKTAKAGATKAKAKKLRSRNLEDDFEKELKDLDNLDDNDDNDDKIRNLEDSKLYENGLDIGRVQADLTNDKDVPNSKDMEAGKKEAAVTAISTAAAKGFKKVNDLMNKATSYLKNATGEMARADCAYQINYFNKILKIKLNLWRLKLIYI